MSFAPKALYQASKKKINTEIMGSIVGVPNPYDHASNVSHEIKVSTCKMVVLGEKGVGKLPSEPARFCFNTTLVKVLQHWKIHGEGRKQWVGNTRRSMPTSVPHLFARVGEWWQGGEPRKCPSKSGGRGAWLLYVWKARHSLRSPAPIKDMKGRDENRKPKKIKLVCVKQRCVPKIFAFFLVFITYQVGEGSSAALYAVQDASMC